MMHAMPMRPMPWYHFVTVDSITRKTEECVSFKQLRDDYDVSLIAETSSREKRRVVYVWNKIIMRQR